MRSGLLLVALAFAAMPFPAIIGRAERLSWNTFPPLVGDALQAFRQTGHPIAEATRRNLDGDELGRITGDGALPMNFDPTSHLFWIVADFNRDRQTEVLLLFQWRTITGNNPAEGVIMQQIGERWRVACEFDHDTWGNIRGRGQRIPLVLLDQRTHGWRHFRVFSGTYGWQRAPEGQGAMDCVWLGETRLR